MSDPDRDRIVTYEPNDALRHGPLAIVRSAFGEIFRSRWLTFQLFKRDLGAIYKQSVLGLFWAVIVPLVTIGTFVVLKDTGVVSAGAIETPYSVYASVGVAIWQLFAQGLIAGANSLSSGGDMITRINFSKMSLVIASMGKAVISSAVLALLCVGVIVYNLTAGSWTWTFGVQMLLFPLMLLPVVALTVGLSFYLAILNAVVRDIGTLLGILLTFLMLLTPVLYQKPPVGAGGGKVIVELLSTYNPLYYLVTAPRDLLLRGSVDVGAGFWISTGVAAAVFFFGVLSFHLAEARIAERM